MFSSSLGAMGSLLGKLRPLRVYPGHQLPETLNPQKDKLQLLIQDLEEINTLLGNLSRVHAPNTMAKLWMNEVRNLSYDIEDYIDKTMSPSYTCEENPEIPFEVEEFGTLVKHARARYSRYNLGRWACNPMPMVADGQVRLPTLSGQATDLVGIGDATTKFINLLSNDAEQGMKVVFLIGPAGVGKSTLAKEVYRQMGGQFDHRAFVRASRMPDTRRLLQSIISQVQRHQRPPHGLSVQELIDNLREHLQQKRYMCVTPPGLHRVSQKQVACLVR